MLCLLTTNISLYANQLNVVCPAAIRHHAATPLLVEYELQDTTKSNKTADDASHTIEKKLLQWTQLLTMLIR